MTPDADKTIGISQEVSARVKPGERIGSCDIILLCYEVRN